VINWRLLGRRLRRPLLWVALAALVLGGAVGAAGANWLKPEPRVDQPGFRFEDVFVVSSGTHGNFTDLRIVPWMSNPGDRGIGTMRLVVYVIDSNTNLVQNESRLDLGRLSARRTVNASAPFELNNTRSYTIQILALEDDFLVAKGYGSIGFQRPVYYYEDANALRAYTTADADVQVTSGGFSYEYPGG